MVARGEVFFIFFGANFTVVHSIFGFLVHQMIDKEPGVMCARLMHNLLFFLFYHHSRRCLQSQAEGEVNKSNARGDKSLHT